MATTTVSGGTTNAGSAVSSDPNVSNLTKTLLNNVNGSGGVFTTNSVGTPSSPALVQGADNSVFVVEGTSNVVQVGSQRSTYVIADQKATIAGGTGSGTIVGGAGGALLGTSTVPGGSYQLLGSTGNDTIIAAAGNNTIQGGAGTNVEGVFGGSNIVGVGQVSGANDTAVITGGNNTIFGGQVSSLIGVTGGTNTVVGGAAAETIVGGGGNNVFAGGGGQDLFLFTNLGVGGNYTVTDFGVGGTADTVAFVGLGATSVDKLLANATESGGSVKITFASSNVTVTFQNTTIASLRGNILLS
ncbi:hypothetical protein [Jiella sp. M17.18]|uniref:hypothetical protein n=1 Tax=Jiella sp. M17.18 TaxID=3234247 RepID=UPI0034DFE5E3